jgi:plastocyanin
MLVLPESGWDMPKIAGIALLAGLVLGACGGGGRPSQASGNGPTSVATNPGPTVSVENLDFRPRSLEVARGSTVTWTSADTVVHTVTSGAARTPDGRFHTELTERGATFRFTFNEAGPFPYFCAVHQGMEGNITVK